MSRVIGVICAGFLTVFSAQANAQQLRAAVLPQSRSVQVGQPATAFAIVLNTTNANLTNCGIALGTSIPSAFSFFQTSPANAITGARNAKANIPANGFQNFLFELVPQLAIAPTDLSFAFTCDGVPAAPVSAGVNTFLFSASTTPVPDILSIGAVLSNDGITNVPGVNVAGALGLMTVAAVNLGADVPVTAEVALSNSSIPASATICETNITTGACLSPPTSTPISTRVARASAGSISAYSVFVSATAAINFDPANVRVIVRFRDQAGAVRGATSAALRTRNLVAADTNRDGVWDDVGANAQRFLSANSPSVPNAIQQLTPMIRNTQDRLLLSDLNDQSINNANATMLSMACIFRSIGNPNTAADVVAALDPSILNNQDRLSAGLTASSRLTGTVFQIPDASSVTCP
jgi:hypothetical protein